MPGTMPAKNSLVIDKPLTTPKRMKLIEGGMTGPMMPPPATRPAAYFLSWPAATIIGTRSVARAAASAAAEPDSEARTHEARMVT